MGELGLANEYLRGSGEWFALAKAPPVADNSSKEDYGGDIVDGGEASEPCEANAGCMSARDMPLEQEQVRSQASERESSSLAHIRAQLMWDAEGGEGVRLGGTPPVASECEADLQWLPGEWM